MYEKTLAGNQAAAIEDIGPHRKERLRQCRRFDQPDAARHLQALRRRRGAIFGVPAAGNKSADLLPLAPVADIAAERRDRARYFQPEHRRGAGWRRIVAGALQYVAA